MLIRCLDSDDLLFDTVSAHNITPPEGIDVLNVKPGDRCQAAYENRHYSVKVVATGKSL